MRVSQTAFERATWIVVPVSGFSRGKTRLAPVLGPLERMRLNRRLLAHTLRVLAHWRGLEHCIVVSGCARALFVARAAGAIGLLEPHPRRGLNIAVARAVAQALRSGARRVLILPCDLPRLSAAALEAMVGHAQHGVRLVIAPDRAGTGTNALLLAARSRFDFRYGADSRSRHLDAARARGWVASVCACPELTLDLDTPQDLDACEGDGIGRGPLRRML